MAINNALTASLAVILGTMAVVPVIVGKQDSQQGSAVILAPNQANVSGLQWHTSHGSHTSHSSHGSHTSSRY